MPTVIPENFIELAIVDIQTAIQLKTHGTVANKQLMGSYNRIDIASPTIEPSEKRNPQ